MTTLSTVDLVTRLERTSIGEYPFPHLVLEDFLPAEFVPNLLSDLRALEGLPPDNSYESAHGRKREWKAFPSNLTALGAWSAFLRAPEFADVLARRFGLGAAVRLSYDPTHDGGGYVISPPGAFLQYHADFNFSSKAGRFRVLNLLFYVNEDYAPACGGALHLLDAESRTVEKVVHPRLNTLAAFLTDDLSFHGVARNHGDFARRSFNIYYYSDAPLSARQSSQPHRTIWIAGS